MKFYIGIDPGKTGAFVVVDQDGKVRSILPTPLQAEQVDYHAIAEWLECRSSPSYYAIIEKVHAMPDQGVTSMFNFGFNVGVIHGILTAYRIPFYAVPPKTWKKEILKGYNTQDKASSVQFISQAYPQVSLLRTPRCKKLDNNIADAICIALYGKAHY